MSRDVLRIFVSSPGDVGEERVMTARVVQRLQGWFGQSVKLEPIIWEHEPMRATQHPQEQIPLPSECDIVVCLLWSRLGTRLPEKISAAGKTGTEWEFEEAARSFRDKKTPDLLVYRKTREVLASVDDETTYAEKKSQWNALSRVPHVLVQCGRRHVQGGLQNVRGAGPIRGLAGTGPAQAHPGPAQADAAGRQDLAPRAFPGPGGFRL